jgi:SAM-dependent methyltransferase
VTIIAETRARVSSQADVLPAQAAWLLDRLVCPSCRHVQLEQRRRGLVCPACTAGYTSQNGVIELVTPELLETLLPQREAWSLLEKACGRYDHSLEQVEQYPLDPLVRAQFDWLRALLKSRGRCRVLELGAGRGWASRLLAEDGHDVVATDILDDPQIGLGCAARLRDETATWFGTIVTPAESLPFHDHSFDVVFSFATLRHIVDMHRVLKEVERVLRPGGWLCAMHEPFRGGLTTGMQRLQNCLTYQLLRWWQPDTPAGAVQDQRSAMSNNLGSTFYEICRRGPFCQAAGEEAGLHTVILPVALLLTLSPDMSSIAEHAPAIRANWLQAAADTYGLDIDRLTAWVEEARAAWGKDLLPEVLAHWIAIGNVDGVLLAQKGGGELAALPAFPATTAAAIRPLDPVLMACAEQNLLPVYGFYGMEQAGEVRYRWAQPQCGFLVPGSDSVQVTVACPGMPFRAEPVRIEVRVEGERVPVLVFVMEAGKTVTFNARIPERYSQQPSVLIRLSAGMGFMPSDYTGSIQDIRLLALQVIKVAAGELPREAVQESLQFLCRPAV